MLKNLMDNPHLKCGFKDGGGVCHRCYALNNNSVIYPKEPNLADYAYATHYGPKGVLNEFEEQFCCAHYDEMILFERIKSLHTYYKTKNISPKEYDPEDIVEDIFGEVQDILDKFKNSL